MIDIRFFRRGHFRKTLIEDGRLVVEEHVNNAWINRLGIVGVVVLGAALFVLSLVYSLPLTTNHASLLLAVILVAAVFSWVRMKKDHENWLYIQSLPEKEQVNAAIATLSKPIVMWPYLFWVAFVILIATGDGSQLFSPSFLMATPDLRLAIYILLVLLISAVVGWFIYDQRCRIQDADIQALDRWREELR